MMSVFLGFQSNNMLCELSERSPNPDIYKQRCIILSFFMSGSISSIGEIEYDEGPVYDVEDLWRRYFKEDGSESDVYLDDYSTFASRQLPAVKNFISRSEVTVHFFQITLPSP